MRRNDWMSLVFAAAVLASGAPQGVRAEEGAAKNQVVVSVQFLDVTAADYARAVAGITVGDDHDSMLLEALLKGGAKTTEAPRLVTLDGVEARMETSQEVPYDTADGQHHVVNLKNSVDATPRCNADGTIGTEIKIERMSIAPGGPPATTHDGLSTTRTLADGKACILGGWAPSSDADTMLHLVSLKVTATPNKP